MCSALGLITADTTLLGVNYDFQYDHGLLIINPRNLHKWSEAPGGARFFWQSNYGSATLVQFGCELPNGGMNEAGLSIHLLEQRDAVYPSAVQKEPVISELQWIQYQLDTSKNVDEVIATLDSVTVKNNFIPLHYMVADGEGECAVIGFVNGRVEVTRAQKGVPLALTNLSQHESERWYSNHQMPRKPVPRNAHSLSRYYWLKKHCETYHPQLNAESFVENGLKTVAIKGKIWDPILQCIAGMGSFRTCWQVLFNPMETSVAFSRYQTGQGCQFNMAQWDFSALNVRLSCDLYTAVRSDIPSCIAPYTVRENRRTVEKTYRPYKRYFPKHLVEELIHYPDKFRIIE